MDLYNKKINDIMGFKKGCHFVTLSLTQQPTDSHKHGGTYTTTDWFPQTWGTYTTTNWFPQTCVIFLIIKKKVRKPMKKPTTHQLISNKKVNTPTDLPVNGGTYTPTDWLPQTCAGLEMKIVRGKRIRCQPSKPCVGWEVNTATMVPTYIYN